MSRCANWFPCVLGLFFCIVVTVSLEVFHYSNGLVFGFAGLAIILTVFPLLALAAEFGTMLIVAALLVPHGPVACFPSIAATMMVLSSRTPSKFACLLILPLCAGWLASFGLSGCGYSGLEIAVLVCIFLSLIGFSFDTLLSQTQTIKKIDLILNSASGNTAHYAKGFVEGSKRAGAEVIVHRFHDFRAFDAQLSGDALAIAFPVVGWKPPWPFLFYLLRHIPDGHGKPAFVLMTSAGGPENTALIAKLALILRGYRPVGQSWGIYPVNVATLRIGLPCVWRWLDRLVPRGIDRKWAVRAGEAFVTGLPLNQPMIVWPTPMALVGFLGDNPWINVLIYRNHAFRRRCTKCGLCIRYCPAHRLRFVRGYPKACGTCILCFGCVNICPTKAMQIWFFTEYGNPYKPRWPELMAENIEPQQEEV